MAHCTQLWQLLREHQATLQATLKHSPYGIFIVAVETATFAASQKVEFLFVGINPAAYRMLRIPKSGESPLLLHECLNPELARNLHNLLLDCLSQQQTVHGEIAFVAQGNNCNMLVTLSPVLNTNGSISKIAGLCEDRTQQKRLVAEIELLRSITEVLHTRETHFTNVLDLTAVFKMLLGRVCEATGWDYGEVWFPNAGESALECSPAWYTRNQKFQEFRQASHKMTFSPGTGLPGRVWLSKQPEWDIDVSIQPDTVFLRAKIAAQCGIGAGLGIPIIANDRVLGVLVFFLLNSRPPDRRVVDLVWAIADQLGMLLQQQQTEVALRQAESKYRSIFENAVEGIFQTTPEGQFITVNPMLARIYGYDSPAQLMETISDIQHQVYVDPKRRTEFVALLEENDRLWGFESQIYRRDGSVIWIREHARTIRNGAGQLLGYEGTVEDISQRKQAETEANQCDLLLRGVAEAMNHLIANSDREVAVNLALATLGMAAGVHRVYICERDPALDPGMLGMTKRFEWVREGEVLKGPTISSNPTMSTDGRVRLDRWYKTLTQKQIVKGLTRMLPQSEQSLLSEDGIISVLMVPISIDRQFWGYIGFGDCHRERQWSSSEESILSAIAASLGAALQRYQAEMVMQHQASHDLLTGLPNRMLFDRQLPRAIVEAQTQGHRLAVMFLDLDRFKLINDTLGHPVGDELLQQVAHRLKDCLRDCDTIARWGGDEFILLLPDIHIAEDAIQIAQRILNALQPAFFIHAHQLRVSGSIGMAIYPDDGEDGETLTKNADVALYRAKDKGRNNYQLYQPNMSSEASESLILRNSLYQALEKEEFLIYYQPQINNKTGEITGMEALTYWQHPELGLISPQTFIPLAEEMGLMVSIGHWVLKTACTQNKVWQKIGFPPIFMAVNLSARQFKRLDLVTMVSEVLEETNLDPHLLELEITETIAMQDVELTRRILRDLQTMGVRITMDDFGIGYASLSYLKLFPFNKIKIDQSFIQGLSSNSTDTAIVQAILALGHGLNLSVVAEGVETERHQKLLRRLHCEEIQGYLVSPPLIAKDATQLLEASILKQVRPH